MFTLGQMPYQCSQFSIICIWIITLILHLLLLPWPSLSTPNTAVQEGFARRPALRILAFTLGLRKAYDIYYRYNNMNGYDTWSDEVCVVVGIKWE